jgi:serine protease Do
MSRKSKALHQLINQTASLSHGVFATGLILLSGLIAPSNLTAQAPQDRGSPRYTSSSQPRAATNRGAAQDPFAQRTAEYRQLDSQIEQLDSQFGILRRIYKLTDPTVVHIEATKEPVRDQAFNTNTDSKPVDEAGAGIVVAINSQPYVITNRHVVYPSQLSKIRIEFSSRVVVRPTDIWTDPTTDIAVMALPSHNGPTARIGDSRTTEIGDYVLAIGSPFGLSRSLTYGILSAKGRRNLELGTRPIEIQDFFQTDAAINPGNSGGPLINLRGEVIGINTAIASNSGGSEGIGFAIPINLVLAVAERLVGEGQLQRAYLGVQMDNDFNVVKARQLGLNSPVGALVKAVRPQSPAESAGLQVGDVILKINATPIENDGHLVQHIGLESMDGPINAIVFRNRSEIRIPIQLIPMPTQ